MQHYIWYARPALGEEPFFLNSKWPTR